MRLGMLAISLPLVEIAAFVIVGRWIGVLPVLGLVVVSAVAGVALMKSTGTATAIRVQQAMRGRENPLLAVGSAAFRVVAGLLLLVPGFVTDVLALVLLLSPVQALLLARVAAAARQARRPGEAAATAEVIEGEAIDVTPRPGAAGDRSGWTRH
jgi:UPF0716 protein FxsA